MVVASGDGRGPRERKGRPQRLGRETQIGAGEKAKPTMLGPVEVANFSIKSGMAILANFGVADIHPRSEIFKSSAVIP